MKKCSLSQIVQQTILESKQSIAGLVHELVGDKAIVNNKEQIRKDPDSHLGKMSVQPKVNFTYKKFCYLPMNIFLALLI